MPKTLRIATRKSPLALWQTEHVATLLRQHHPSLAIELIPLSTTGDNFLDKPLINIGGKGLFLKELEEAMLDDRADLAVHSIKDMPAELPAGFCLATILERADVRDALVCNRANQLGELKEAAIVGTASLRRGSQLKALRPDLIIKPIRGNVQTRLRKLAEEDYDATILAYSGLERLGLAHLAHPIDIEHSLPAVGQGAIGIECRADHHELLTLLATLNHAPTQYCVSAERRMNQVLGGSCHIAVAGYAELNGEQLTLRGLVASPDGQTVLRSQASLAASQAQQLGQQVAEALLAQGAQAVIDSC